jgi:capsular polysaccharide biosynthesis protein
MAEQSAQGDEQDEDEENKDQSSEDQQQQEGESEQESGADRTEVEVSQLDTVVELSVEDESAKTAARIADQVAAALIGAVGRLETADRPTEETPNIEGVVVGPAEVASSPADPNWKLYLLSGLAAGLLVGLSVVAVRQVLRAPDVG